MVDAASDIIDWVAELTWNGAGIVASILVAVIVVSGVIADRASAWRTTNKRKQLGLFLIEGQQLHTQCHDEKQPPPIEETNDWLQRVHDYLADHLGDDYVATFHNEAGLPSGYTTISSMEHSGVAGAIKFRLARLQQFLDELRR